MDEFEALDASAAPAVDALVAAGRGRARAEFAEAEALLEAVAAKHRACVVVRDPEHRRLAREAAFDALGAKLGMKGRAVHHRHTLLVTLTDDLPICWRTWSHGLIDERRALAIAQAARTLSDDESIRILDARAAGQAPGRTLTGLRTWLNRQVALLEPAQAETRHLAAKADRRVWIDHDNNGMSWLGGYLPTLDAFRIDKLLDRTARTARAAGDQRTLEQLRADVLRDLILNPASVPAAEDTRHADDPAPGTTIADQTSASAPGHPNAPANHPPTHGRPRPGVHLGVIIPLTSLLGLSDTPAETLDGQIALPASLVREIASTPGTIFQRILTDPIGNVLAIDPQRYRPTEAQRHAIAIRDGTCLVPGCDVPAEDCDIDHREPWPRGPTTATNLTALCRRHHNYKTSGLLQIGSDDQRALRLGGTRIWPERRTFTPA